MKKTNIKEHTKKHIEISKKAASGIYPNKDIAKIGSKVGLGLGVVLCGVGVYGVSKNIAVGMGGLIGGSVTVFSNLVNLKRLEKK